MSRSIRPLLAGCALAVLLAPVAAVAQADWPTRPIQVIVPWGAGGGTDVIVRQLAALLEADLGQPINVVNRTGGVGVIGHTALAQAAPDGYTFGTVNVDLSQTLCLGQTDLTYEDFAHVGLFSVDPSGLVVHVDSPWHTPEELIESIRGEPAGTYHASGTARGGIHHLSFVGWLMAEDVDPDLIPWVPSDGEAPSIRDLAAQAIDVATPPLSSARAMIADGRIRPLATMGANRNPLFPDIPTISEARDIDWVMGTWRMLAGPADLPAEIRERMEEALRDAVHSDTFQQFMQDNGFETAWMTGEEARAFHARQDEEICEIMRAVGMVEN